MSKLIPEKRVDKNGRSVTRHIRASKALPPTKPLPIPVHVAEARRTAGDDNVSDFIKALKAEGLELEEWQIQSLLDKDEGVDGTDKVSALVAKFGYEKALSFHSYSAAYTMLHYLSYRDDEYVIPKVIFFDEMIRVSDELLESGVRERKLAWTGNQFRKAVHWHDAGLTPEEAVDCHRGLITTEQAIAIHEGIVPSVSSGWL